MSDSDRGERSEALAEQSESAQSGNEAAKASDTQKPAQPNNSPPAINESIPPDEGKVSQSEAERQEQDPYKARDIVAQEAMADASIAMAVAAFLTFLVTTAGTILIWKQIKLLNKTVQSTNDATEAMVRSNEISQVSQKAWIEPSAKVMDFPNGRGHRVAISCRNQGQTRAMNVHIEVHRGNEVPKVIPQDGDASISMLLGPGDDQVFTMFQPSPPDAHSYFVYGRALYDCAFGEAHVSHFCWQIQLAEYDPMVSGRASRVAAPCIPASWPPDT